MWKWVKDRLRRIWPFSLIYRLRVRNYVRHAYHALLLRDPDSAGLDHYSARLRSGEITGREMFETLRSSEEFRLRVHFNDILNSLHWSRCDFVRGLPRARRILDLGGAHKTSPYGALLMMGYPYEFEKLVIVDLPKEERHPLYREGAFYDRVVSPNGPVVYSYQSMTDLSEFPDGDFDFVYCGQAIEHISREEARAVLPQVFRVLEPGGVFALDTPNAAVCRLEQKEMINPDHKYEYTHGELSDELRQAGFEILEAKGLNWAGKATAEGRDPGPDAAWNHGVFYEIEECYLLAYVCRRPS